MTNPDIKNPRAEHNFVGRTCSITAVGSYVPKKVLTNAALEELVDTNDEWIITRTGIRERRIAADPRASPERVKFRTEKWNSMMTPLVEMQALVRTHDPNSPLLADGQLDRIAVGDVRLPGPLFAVLCNYRVLAQRVTASP